MYNISSLSEDLSRERTEGSFLKVSSYKYIPDTRPLDDWGRPIGRSYLDKQWDELTPVEQMADFDWKSEILASYGEPVTCWTFYQDYVFHELYNEELDGEYKVLLTEYNAAEGNKVHKLDVDEIADYLELNDVALSPCLFYGNWRRKKLLNYVAAFVLDVDKVRPRVLQRFIELFNDGRLLRPTFIVNSGSGLHFFYLLDSMLRCDSGRNEANNLIAEEIYRKLYDDVIKKEKWTDAQRHWLGQDYRVVGSRTKLNQVAQAFKIGDVYRIDDLIKYYDIQVDRKKNYASKAMVNYASNIAKDLKIEPPDFTDSKETYAFIRDHKDAAYEVRESRRKSRESKPKNRKSGTWYKKTLNYLMDNTSTGYRFSSLKALAIIAFKEKVPKDVFEKDIKDLTEHWQNKDWNGDEFNSRNVEAIERLYDQAIKYSNTSSEKLEEWLGHTFRRIGNRRNGRTQKEHLARARAVQAIDYPDGSWRNKNGRPDLQAIVQEWRKNNPDGRKSKCIVETGLSKPTVYKWWDKT